jgi:beta-lactam-binding protein with PASTA domain
VLVGLGAAYAVTRKDRGAKSRAARATTTVVQTQPAAPTATSHQSAAPAPAPTATHATRPAKTKTPPAAPTPRRIAVPNVLGISSDEAVSHLRSAGFEARVQDVSSPKPTGTVVTQSPDPNTKLAKGAVVTLQASKGPRSVVVPDVTGQDQQQAVAALENIGLKARLVAVPSVKPVGTVVAQWPRPGAKLPAGRSVQVNAARTAPKGQQETQQPQPSPPPPVTVPEVRGLKLELARRKLRAAGLVTEVKYVPSQEASGTVVSQAPKPGKTLKRGDHVLVNASVGSGSQQPQPSTSQPATVPNVIGLKLSAARQKIRSAGLVTEVKYVPSQEPSGTVVSQAPKPGKTLPRGGHVLVNASDGSQASQPAQQASVPDVMGQDEQPATNALQQAGFEVDVVDEAVDSADQDGLVQDEQPAGGTQAPAGSMVTLYVGRFSQGG